MKILRTSHVARTSHDARRSCSSACPARERSNRNPIFISLIPFPPSDPSFFFHRNPSYVGYCIFANATSPHWRSWLRSCGQIRPLRSWTYCVCAIGNALCPPLPGEGEVRWVIYVIWRISYLQQAFLHFASLRRDIMYLDPVLK
jgi:hypothetical protein